MMTLREFKEEIAKIEKDNPDALDKEITVYFNTASYWIIDVKYTGEETEIHWSC